MAVKRIKVMTLYGEEIKVPSDYENTITRVLNDEHIVPRDYAEKSMIRRMFQKPDYYVGNMGIYADIEMRDGTWRIWGNLTPEQKAAFRDYFVYKMAKGLNLVPYDEEEAARQEERMKEVYKIIEMS